MPFETQKKNSSIDKSCKSPSIKENNKNEIDLVNKKVIKTKQEIEHLKLELQKLINTGLCKENKNSSKADVKHVEQLPYNGQQLLSINNTNCDIDQRNYEKNVTAREKNILLKYNNLPKLNHVPSNITTRINYISLKKCSVSNNENNKMDLQKKKIEYNKEKAREYIKKQKEKRTEQMKAKIKETENEIDLRKKKLKELHEKSLQLVSKNVKQKKKRCHQSCERKGTASTNKPFSAFQSNSVCNLLSKVPNAVIEDVEEFNPNYKNENEKSTESLSYKNLKETTNELRHDLNRKINGLSQLKSCLQSESFCNTDISLLHSNINREELLCKAATTIQAYFRGFRQRKLYKSILNVKQNENNLEKSKLAWLEVPTTLPYPYNFINAVKKKLSCAVNKKNSEKKDFSELSKTKESFSFIDHLKIKKNNENLASKLVQTVENSENHQHFHEETEATNHIAIPSNFKGIRLSESNITFWRNKSVSYTRPLDFQINLSENLINQTNSDNDGCNLKSFLSSKCLDLDLQTIKPLSLKPLQIDSQYFSRNTKRECTSDSDTSKNIPDISTESSMQTKQVHLWNSSDSSNKTDDYNLVCNLERHNNLRKSRGQKMANADETIQTLLLHQCTDDKNVLQKKDENVNELGLNCTISKYFSSEDHKKPLLPTNNIISHINDSTTTTTTITKAREIEKITCNTEASCPEKENIENTAMLSSFLSYMQCMDIETYTKLNAKSEKGSEKIESATASPFNSKCKEINLRNTTEDSSECYSVIDERKYSSDFESLCTDKLNFVPSLKCPSVTLNTSHVSLHKTNDQFANHQVPLDQTFRFEQPKTVNSKINSNEIHLKFEAEIRLLHHFNKSLQEAVEKEKSLLENQYVPNNKNGDIKEKNSNNAVTSNAKSNAKLGTINYSRGSDVLNSCEPFFTTSTTTDVLENSLFLNTNLDLSSVRDINESDNSNSSNSTTLSIKKQHENNLFPGLSLGMFDQLIKDEDARIENLKTILKIREKSLLDRTKSELAWLEIQKRYLKDSGQLHEISMIKKKQRGLLVKLQHERHEMQRLKQMQKAASKERKTRLRQQRNMIKAQLSTNSETVSKLKSSLSRERRHSSGPLKVVGVYRYNESALSETSLFPNNYFAINDDNNMTSLSRSSQSIASNLLTDEIVTSPNPNHFNDSDPKQDYRGTHNEHLKRSLLMRETALQKRRKVAEELLQWHQRLVEEERQIAELEYAANSIITQVTANPSFSVQDETTSPFTLKGCQLNIMWQNMNGRQGQRFNDNELYIMSNEAIQQFCIDAKKGNEEKFNRNISNSDNLKIDHNKILTKIGDEIDLKNQENDKDESNFVPISSANLTKTDSDEVTEKIIENIPNKTRKNGESSHISYSEDFEENSLNTCADFDPIVQVGCMPCQNTDVCFKDGPTVDNNELKTTSDLSVSTQAESIENSTNTKNNESISDLKTNTEVPFENKSCESNEIAEKIGKDISSFKHISTSTNNPSKCEGVNDECLKKANSDSVEYLNIDVDYNKEYKKETSIPDVINKVYDYESQITALDSLSSRQNKLIVASEVVQVAKITEIPDILCKTRAYEESNILPTKSEIVFKNEKGDLSASEVDFSLAVADGIQGIQSEYSFKLSEDRSSSKNVNNYFYDIVTKTEQQQIPTVENNEIETTKNEDESQTDNETSKKKNVTGQFESSSISIDTAEKNERVDIKEKTDQETNNELLNKYDMEPLKIVSTKDEIKNKEAKFEKDTLERNDGRENVVGMNDLKKDSCNYKNVQKRILDNLTDSNASRSEQNSQLQNVRLSAYNTSSSESGILLVDKQILPKHSFATEEEEELVKKQLAIEQEIKQIEQQQKEHLPYLYLREIPNKPPPPYMPPAPTASIPSVFPSSAEQVNLIVHHISNYLFNANSNGSLPNVFLLPEIKRQMQCQIEPACQRFIFDLCKELTVEHYKQFEEESEPCWMRITKRPKLAFQKAFDERTLEKFLMKKVKETLGYEKIDRKESMIIKWSRKRRDHVDELLVLESQNEEAEWTNYDKDELIVINELTNEILNSLIDETVHILRNILEKRITNPN